MTAFDVTNYPLTTDTDLSPDLGVEVDRLASGGIKTRQTTTVQMIEVTLHVKPLSETESTAFLAYLRSIGASRREIDIEGGTYSGAIVGKSLRVSYDGPLRRYSFTFQGELQ